MERHRSLDNAATIELLRATLDEVFRDHRFVGRKSLSAGQVAHYVLTQISYGERNVDNLKASAFEKILNASST